MVTVRKAGRWDVLKDRVAREPREARMGGAAVSWTHLAVPSSSRVGISGETVAIWGTKVQNAVFEVRERGSREEKVRGVGT
mgnify:CR=1 FL=1